MMNAKQAEQFCKSDKLKIITTPMKEYDGCSWYRLRQFSKTANSLELATVEEFNTELPARLLEETFKAADVFFVRFHTEVMVDIIKTFKAQYPNKVVIFDTDDDAFNLNPLNDSYNTFGTGDVTLADGTYLWKSGEKDFDAYLNRHRLVDYEYCLEQSDATFTTTLRLAESLKEHGATPIVIPNAIDFNFWPKLEIKKDPKKITMVWAGGSSHYEDLYLIKDGLKQLMTENPNLHFAVVGQLFPGLVKELPKDRVHFWPWVKADGHGYRMACVNADIAIAPLKDMEFNYSKSSIKYYEYSALGVPTVASDVPPYSDDINNNVNGLLFKDSQEFVKQVQKLIQDPILRLTLGENAYRWVKENREIEKITKEWIEAIKGIVEAKKA